MYILKKYPESIVNGLIFNKEGDILLVKNEKWKNKLTLPGGHIEIGETFEDSVIREVREKVGIDVKVDKMINVQEFLMHPEYFMRKHLIVFNFSCSVEGRNLVELHHQSIRDYVWIHPEDAFYMNVEPYTLDVIRKYLSGKNAGSSGYKVTNADSDIKVRI